MATPYRPNSTGSSVATQIENSPRPRKQPSVAAPVQVGPATQQPPKLLDQVRAKLRVLHYSIRTEEAYVDWIRRFILFHGKRHPREMGSKEIEQFLTHLAVADHVAASTQNQALSAILFLYRTVLAIELPPLNAVRAKRPERIPVVMSVAEVRLVLERIQGEDGTYRMMAELMYGSGLRLLECCRLRVKDIDFERRQIIVREGKGDKDRAMPLPERLDRQQPVRPRGGLPLPANCSIMRSEDCN